MGTKAPPVDGLDGTPVFLFVYVNDVDAVIKRAVELGARLKCAAQDQFYGDRDGFIIDRFGHGWTIASHLIRAGSREEAERIAAGDPYTVADHTTFDLIEWEIHEGVRDRKLHRGVSPTTGCEFALAYPAWRAGWLGELSRALQRGAHSQSQFDTSFPGRRKPWRTCTSRR